MADEEIPPEVLALLNKHKKKGLNVTVTLQEVVEEMDEYFIVDEAQVEELIQSSTDNVKYFVVDVPKTKKSVDVKKPTEARKFVSEAEQAKETILGEQPFEAKELVVPSKEFGFEAEPIEPKEPSEPKELSVAGSLVAKDLKVLSIEKLRARRLDPSSSLFKPRQKSQSSLDTLRARRLVHKEWDDELGEADNPCTDQVELVSKVQISAFLDETTENEKRR